VTFTGGTALRFFHRTTADVAAAIIARGFRDGRGRYLTDREWTGVWLSDRPLNEHPDADTLLEVRLALTEGEVADYEWVEDDKGYREWLVPAALINAHATIRIVPPDEEDAL
jgi:hypothetical protein